MAILLPTRPTTQHRLLCSECRNPGDNGLKCLFQFHGDRPEDMIAVVDEFELRIEGGKVEALDTAPGAEWKPFPGGHVYCRGCYAASAGQSIVIFDPVHEECAIVWTGHEPGRAQFRLVGDGGLTRFEFGISARQSLRLLPTTYRMKLQETDVPSLLVDFPGSIGFYVFNDAPAAPLKIPRGSALRVEVASS